MKPIQWMLWTLELSHARDLRPFLWDGGHKQQVLGRIADSFEVETFDWQLLTRRKDIRNIMKSSKIIKTWLKFHSFPFHQIMQKLEGTEPLDPGDSHSTAILPPVHDSVVSLEQSPRQRASDIAVPFLDAQWLPSGQHTKTRWKNHPTINGSIN